MKRTTVFIIKREASVANLIRYHLLSSQVKHVQVFPTLAECRYFMEKRSIPDFLVADLSEPEIRAPGFLGNMLHAFPGIRILILSPYTDNSLSTRLMEEGATDYIYTSGRMEDWIRELAKNMEFLVREKSRASPF